MLRLSFMKFIRHWIAAVVLCGALLFWGGGCATPSDTSQVIVPAAPPSVPTAATTPAVYVPDVSRASQPLPEGVLAWDGIFKTVDATNGQDFARFIFSFTNIAKKVETGWITNVATGSVAGFWGKKKGRGGSGGGSTNRVVFTNSAPIPVTILSVHPSCGCTTVELPPVPWTIPPGSSHSLKISVNLAGKSGTLFKTINVATDQGNMNLSVRINLLPPVVRTMTDADRARAMEAAKVDRQAVFKGDCASCHVKPGVGKYGKELYEVACGICHESPHRASMVTDLHALKTPTNEDFWRTWIQHGKPGSLMPAFSSAEGGPLNDVQIASLAAYLNTFIPSKVPAPPQ